MEFKDKPIYATQFHPEKNAFNWKFNWNTVNIIHSEASVIAMQYFWNRFLQDARDRNNPKILPLNITLQGVNITDDDSNSFNKLFIHNYPVTYDATAYFELTYYFKPQISSLEDNDEVSVKEEEKKNELMINKENLNEFHEKYEDYINYRSIPNRLRSKEKVEW